MEPRLGPETFDVLWARHAHGLLRFFARRTMDPEAAMDLVAETFAAAFVARATFRGTGEDEAAGWLFGIARNQLALWYRHGARPSLTLPPCPA